MKKLLPIILICGLLCGCGSQPAAPLTHPDILQTVYEEIPFLTRFDSETLISLSDDGITVDGQEAPAEGTVYLSQDITYYEDRDTYESGYPYGEGSDTDRHTPEEAAAHTVVNITQPGTYRVTGTLSAGQIRVDLGEEAYHDPNAVVELILDNADITCTVAPAVLFVNVYECDGDWDPDTASSQVDTAAAGANLILEGENTVYGSYVAKIYKDKEGEKKLCKQDGAIYSYMSMNVFGPGSLELTAENEGLDSELHLTVNGGSIRIRSGNDGINTNEDGVSVTTVNAGFLHITAGLGEEGDGIDSNGYLVINGGTVVSSANPAADAGLDSDMGSYIHGGLVIALGSTMDWAESDSDQVTLNLQFSRQQESTGAIVISYPDGTVVFAYDPTRDEALDGTARTYQGAIISTPNLILEQGYHIHVGAQVTGTQSWGMYDAATVTGFTGGSQLCYSGTDMMPGNMGGQGTDMMPGNTGGQGPDMNGQQPPDFDSAPSTGPGQNPDDRQPPELPEDMENMTPPQNMEGPLGTGSASPENILFLISDKVNAFTGITPIA